MDTVYRFEALSDRAKDRARDWYREAVSHDFADFSAETVLEDAARMADILGINLRTKSVKLMGGSTRQDPDIYWAIECRDNGVLFAGSYYYKKGSVKAMASEAPAEYQGKVNAGNAELNRIARDLADVQRTNSYKIQASIHHGRDWRMEIDVEHADDNDMLSSTDAETVRELLHDFASWIETQLTAEWEYRNSDATVDEEIIANEYEFTEDGKRA
jgi:hypothetical protein